jgi:hypothetical protein
MGRKRPCSVCGNVTSKLLFNAKKLDIAICSGKCEHKYLETCSSKEQTAVLRYLDDRTEKTRLYNRIGWIVAGFGALIVAIGFFMLNVDIFLFGVFPLAFGALSTRHFEDRIVKLTRTRKRIII